jgi:fatty acyl-CoA reductase
LIGEFPNTYTFTKNLCERLLLKRRENITLTILRPAIIINSYEEPYEGWVDSVAAAVALFFFCGLGVIK